MFVFRNFPLSRFLDFLKLAEAVLKEFCEMGNLPDGASIEVYQEKKARYFGPEHCVIEPGGDVATITVYSAEQSANFNAFCFDIACIVKESCKEAIAVAPPEVANEAKKAMTSLALFGIYMSEVSKLHLEQFESENGL